MRVYIEDKSSSSQLDMVKRVGIFWLDLNLNLLTRIENRLTNDPTHFLQINLDSTQLTRDSFFQKQFGKKKKKLKHSWLTLGFTLHNPNSINKYNWRYFLFFIYKKHQFFKIFFCMMPLKKIIFYILTPLKCSGLRKTIEIFI